MGDDSHETAVENGASASVSLGFEIANGIRHTVATLDESNAGQVSKSQLQAVVANVCRALRTPFVAEDLENYLPEKENLTVVEFLDFLETKLLPKGQKLNQKELDEMSWVVAGQKYDDDPHLLAKKDAFKLWLSFKKLDIDGALKVDIEELCIALEKFVRGIGVQWNEQALVEFAEDGAVTFWKFIDCLERKFLIGVDKSVLREGLQDLFDTILDEVTKTGFLYKKGHSMLKSQKSRWFVLKPERLTYYASSGYREKKGEIILNGDATVTSIPDKGSNKCRFLVTCGLTKKDYEQTAPDQRTKQAWISAIQTAIDCYGGETPFIRGLKERKAKRDADKAQKAEEERRRKEQEALLDQQRMEIDLLKKRKAEIEKFADEEKAMLDAEIKRREELEELQRNLQQLLEDQKRAREEEERVRAAKERLLEEERKKREELEALRMSQQQELQEEKMQKEELMERQKEQERILEEERKRLQHLEEERMKAEEAAMAAHEKLSAAETAAKNAAEQAKNRVRQLKTSIGLKGTIGPKVDPLVTHRGKGAFTLEEFLNRATEWSGLPLDDEDKAKAVSQPTVAHADELVKASATPASNQNIPEFLKKAAAWSGLNPDTYLEATEQSKSVTPPKVAAKPAKPPRTSVGDGNVKMVNGAPEEGEVLQVASGQESENETGEGSQVVEGQEEEAKGVEMLKGQAGEGSLEEKSKEGKANGVEVSNDKVYPEVEPAKGDASQSDLVDDEGTKEVQVEVEVIPVDNEVAVKDEGPQDVGVESKGFLEEVVEDEKSDNVGKDRGSQEEAGDDKDSQEVAGEDRGSEEAVGQEQSQEEVLEQQGSPDAEANGKGPEVKDVESETAAVVTGEAEAEGKESRVDKVKDEAAMKAEGTDGLEMKEGDSEVDSAKDGGPPEAGVEGGKSQVEEGGGEESQVDDQKQGDQESQEKVVKDEESETAKVGETTEDNTGESQQNETEPDKVKPADAEGKPEEPTAPKTDNEESLEDKAAIECTDNGSESKVKSEQSCQNNETEPCDKEPSGCDKENTEAPPEQKANEDKNTDSPSDTSAKDTHENTALQSEEKNVDNPE